uniref:Uncharacterized protein n=1 Tax=Aegilops tauschii subsp. strangulata TaxID=200361 RepID=A0A453SLT6_AEGTS
FHMMFPLFLFQDDLERNTDPSPSPLLSWRASTRVSSPSTERGTTTAARPARPRPRAPLRRRIDSAALLGAMA